MRCFLPEMKFECLNFFYSSVLFPPFFYLRFFLLFLSFCCLFSFSSLFISLLNFCIRLPFFYSLILSPACMRHYECQEKWQKMKNSWLNNCHAKNDICVKNMKIKNLRKWALHKSYLDGAHVFGNAKKFIFSKISFFAREVDFFAGLDMKWYAQLFFVIVHK